MAALQNCTSLKTPESVAYLTNLEPGYLVITIIGGVVALLTQIIFLTEVIFIARHKDDWFKPGKTMWLLGLYPAFGWTAFLGMVVPRSGDLGNMIAVMYLSASLYVFKRLLMNYYGGRTRMLVILEHDEYNLRSPPLCCCCCCLPNLKVTSKTAHAIEAMVLQFAIIQPIMVYMEAIFIADLREDVSDKIPVIISSVGTVSSMVGLYGLFIFFRVSRARMAHLNIGAKFVCLKLIMGIDAIQKLIMAILVDSDVIPCTRMLNPVDTSVQIQRFMVIIEAFLISLIARVYYKRDQRPGTQLSVKHSSSDDETDALIDDTVKSTRATLVGSADHRYGTIPDGDDIETQHKPDCLGHTNPVLDDPEMQVKEIDPA